MTPTSLADGMTESVFIDTGYILAVVNVNDQQHFGQMGFVLPRL